MPPQIVLDTNVLYSGVYSRLGASFVILNQINTGAIGIHLSTPLVLQYENVLKRNAAELEMDLGDIDIVLDRICGQAEYHRIHFLWRPFLADPKDDLVLELAVASQCSHILTHNIRDFRGIESFGVQAITPIEWLRIFGDSP